MDKAKAGLWEKIKETIRPAHSLTVEQLCAVIDAPLLTGEGNRNKARNPNDPASLVRAGEFAEP